VPSRPVPALRILEDEGDTSTEQFAQQKNPELYLPAQKERAHCELGPSGGTELQHHAIGLLAHSIEIRSDGFTQGIDLADRYADIRRNRRSH
jgi:hypothetical protein